MERGEHLDLRLHDGHRRPGDEPDVPARARLRRHPPRLLPRQLAHVRAALGDVRGRPDAPGGARGRRPTDGASAAAMFTAVYFGGPDIEWWMRLPIFFFILLFFFFVGAAVATIYVRWKATGLVFFFIAFGFAGGRPDRAPHVHRRLGRGRRLHRRRQGARSRRRGCSCRRRWRGSPGSSSCGGPRRVPENRLTGPGLPPGGPGPVGIRMIDSRHWEGAPMTMRSASQYLPIALAIALSLAACVGEPSGEPTDRSRPRLRRPPPSRPRPRPPNAPSRCPRTASASCRNRVRTPSPRRASCCSAAPAVSSSSTTPTRRRKSRWAASPASGETRDVPESTITVSVAPLTTSTRGDRRRQPDRPGPQRGAPRRRHQLRAARRREQRARHPQHHPRRQLGLGHRGPRRRGVLRRGGRTRGRGRGSGVHLLMPVL